MPAPTSKSPGLASRAPGKSRCCASLVRAAAELRADILHDAVADARIGIGAEHVGAEGHGVGRLPIPARRVPPAGIGRDVLALLLALGSIDRRGKQHGKPRNRQYHLEGERRHLGLAIGSAIRAIIPQTVPRARAARRGTIKNSCRRRRNIRRFPAAARAQTRFTIAGTSALTLGAPTCCIIAWVSIRNSSSTRSTPGWPKAPSPQA